MRWNNKNNSRSHSRGLVDSILDVQPGQIWIATTWPLVRAMMNNKIIVNDHALSIGLSLDYYSLPHHRGRRRRLCAIAMPMPNQINMSIAVWSIVWSMIVRINPLTHSLVALFQQYLIGVWDEDARFVSYPIVSVVTEWKVNRRWVDKIVTSQPTFTKISEQWSASCNPPIWQWWARISMLITIMFPKLSPPTIDGASYA